jgi:hypothetical protein
MFSTQVPTLHKNEDFLIIFWPEIIRSCTAPDKPLNCRILQSTLWIFSGGSNGRGGYPLHLEINECQPALIRARFPPQLVWCPISAVLSICPSSNTGQWALFQYSFNADALLAWKLTTWGKSSHQIMSSWKLQTLLREEVITRLIWNLQCIPTSTSDRCHLFTNHPELCLPTLENQHSDKKACMSPSSAIAQTNVQKLSSSLHQHNANCSELLHRNVPTFNQESSNITQDVENCTLGEFLSFVTKIAIAVTSNVPLFITLVCATSHRSTCHRTNCFYCCNNCCWSQRWPILSASKHTSSQTKHVDLCSHWNQNHKPRSADWDLSRHQGNLGIHAWSDAT